MTRSPGVRLRPPSQEADPTGHNLSQELGIHWSSTLPRARFPAKPSHGKAGPWCWSIGLRYREKSGFPCHAGTEMTVEVTRIPSCKQSDSAQVARGDGGHRCIHDSLPWRLLRQSQGHREIAGPPPPPCPRLSRSRRPSTAKRFSTNPETLPTYRRPWIEWLASERSFPAVFQ